MDVMNEIDVMNVPNVLDEMNVLNVFHAREWVSLPFSFPFSFHLGRESKDNNTLDQQL